MARRESHLGYHYLTKWDCRRQWFFTYPVGIELDEPDKAALALGKGVHFAFETYYEVGRKSEALCPAFKAFMEGVEGDPSEVHELSEIGNSLLLEWLKKWHALDLQTYEILAVEATYDIGGLTIRPDVVKRNRVTGEVYPWDVKTTGWSVEKAFHEVDCHDQATAYIWGLLHAHPDWNVQGMIVDVL